MSRRQWYDLFYNSDLSDVREVVDYDLSGFDSTSLWLGRNVQAEELKDVRLIVGPGKRWPDFLISPLSWLIFSERLVAWTKDLIEGDVHLLPAPLTMRRGTPPTYYIVNVTTVIPAVDMERSVVFRDEDGGISSIADIVIREDVEEGHHIFRPQEYPQAVIVSEAFVQAVTGTGAIGLMVEDVSTPVHPNGDTSIAH